uniref:Uncharacterized protein n=1 Tax=Knipowitschia caucasica TaxID=637954 RepID=A0AAV2JH30_KNICA
MASFGPAVTPVMRPDPSQAGPRAESGQTQGRVRPVPGRVRQDPGPSKARPESGRTQGRVRPVPGRVRPDPGPSQARPRAESGQTRVRPDPGPSQARPRAESGRSEASLELQLIMFSGIFFVKPRNNDFHGGRRIINSSTAVLNRVRGQ